MHRTKYKNLLFSVTEVTSYEKYIFGTRPIDIHKCTIQYTVILNNIKWLGHTGLIYKFINKSGLKVIKC